MPPSYLHCDATTPEGAAARYRWELTSATGWSEADITAVVVRAACHLLVDQVRSEGVPELLRTLVELRDVYDQLEACSRAPRLEASTMKSQSARIGEQLSSPPFELELE